MLVVGPLDNYIVVVDAVIPEPPHFPVPGVMGVVEIAVLRLEQVASEVLLEVVDNDPPSVYLLGCSDLSGGPLLESIQLISELLESDRGAHRTQAEGS